MKLGASNSDSSFWIVGYTVPQSHQDNYATAIIVALFFASNNYQDLFKNFSNLWCDIQLSRNFTVSLYSYNIHKDSTEGLSKKK